MTKIKPVGSNMTELHKTDGTVVLFSYETPVAACMGDGGGFIRTDCRWSMTTSKHINKWLDGASARSVPQSELDAIA
jgi:hypothetical protein